MVQAQRTHSESSNGRKAQNQPLRGPHRLQARSRPFSLNHENGIYAGMVSVTGSTKIARFENERCFTPATLYTLSLIPQKPFLLSNSYPNNNLSLSLSAPNYDSKKLPCFLHTTSNISDIYEHFFSSFLKMRNVFYSFVAE